jgi:hypothetical protein
MLREPERQRSAELANNNLELQNERLIIANAREILSLQREFGITTTQLTSTYRQYVSGNLRTLGDTVDRLNAAPGELVEAGTSAEGDA